MRPHIWPASRSFAVGAILVSFTISGIAAEVAKVNCAIFNQGARGRVLQYVKKKYKLSDTSKLTLSQESFVGTTCFRRLAFKSTNPDSGFHLQLFLSPDLRFLSAELLDSTTDPVLEELQKRKILADTLVKGRLPVRGPVDSKVAIVIFSDFQCPYCARLARMLSEEVLPSEGKTVKIIFRHLPLQMHNWALPAAEATACAQDQGDEYFWRLHDFLFEHQREFTAENLITRLTPEVKRLRNFDSRRWATCVANRSTAGRVQADIRLGIENDIAGTPTMFINGKRVATITASEQIRTLIRETRYSSSR